MIALFVYAGKCFVSFLTCNKLIFNILCFYEILRGQTGDKNLLSKR